MNLPIWPEAQPWENYLFAGVAVIIVIIERESMLRTRQGVTEILAPTARGGDDVSLGHVAQMKQGAIGRKEPSDRSESRHAWARVRATSLPSGPCAAPRRLTQAKLDQG
jgi:hypothetical protein